MDAWTIIKALSDMDEQGGTLVVWPETSDAYLQGYFGPHTIRKGEFKPGKYVYQYDVNQANRIELEPDIVLDAKMVDEECVIRLWRVSEGDEGFFPITSVHRDDLEARGFDVSEVDDATMEKLADKMEQAYLDSNYWTDLEYIAEYYGVPKIK